MILADLSTKYTTIILSMRAIIIFKELYSALSESSVVIDPAPAINGKAIGTTDAPEGDSLSLKSSIPNTISRARNRIIIEPAIAKEEISTPKSFKRDSPRNKNKIKIISATIDAFRASILPPLLFILRIMGIDPKISITANITIKTEKTCRILKYIKISLFRCNKNQITKVYIFYHKKRGRVILPGRKNINKYQKIRYLFNNCHFIN